MDALKRSAVSPCPMRRLGAPIDLVAALWCDEHAVVLWANVGVHGAHLPSSCHLAVHRLRCMRQLGSWRCCGEMFCTVQCERFMCSLRRARPLLGF